MGTTITNNYAGPTNGMFSYGSIGGTPANGCRGSGDHKGFGDITDSTSNTVAIGEKGHSDGGNQGGVLATAESRTTIGWPFTASPQPISRTIRLCVWQWLVESDTLPVR